MRTSGTVVKSRKHCELPLLLIRSQPMKIRDKAGETVDVFLAELRRLAVPFGGLSDKTLACAFVA